MERMIQVIERHGGELAFVRLYCDTATHEQRVLADGRQRFAKITNVQALRGALARWNFAAAIGSVRPSRSTTRRLKQRLSRGASRHITRCRYAEHAPYPALPMCADCRRIRAFALRGLQDVAC